jgi:hypothetical protein
MCIHFFYYEKQLHFHKKAQHEGNVRCKILVFEMKHGAQGLGTWSWYLCKGHDSHILYSYKERKCYLKMSVYSEYSSVTER